MKRPLHYCLILLLTLFSLSARAADHLDGVLPLAKDDLAAVAQAKTAPGKHVLLYFGDQSN